MKTLREVLEASAPRPLDTAPTKAERRELSEAKRVYSARFADKMATCLANALRSRFPGVLPDANGGGVESPAQSRRGPKKLDINYSTPQLGLGFGISLKAVHFHEKPIRGYIHNRKRNDEELRTEASGYHQRQPYAVMIAVVFLPYQACFDASIRSPSSFGEWVKYLRPLTGRSSAQDDIDRFERVYVGLYDLGGTEMEFFDVAKAPPRRGKPRALLSFSDFVDDVERAFVERNDAYFEWDDDTTETDIPPGDDDA
jgi:hypothetical protein